MDKKEPSRPQTVLEHKRDHTRKCSQPSHNLQDFVKPNYNSIKPRQLPAAAADDCTVGTTNIVT